MGKELFESTRHLHHACEEHPVGAAMSAGEVTPQVWCDWLGVMHAIHMELDRWLPPYAQVAGNLTLDLIDMLPLRPRERPVRLAQDFARCITTADMAGGAAYVLVGAHRRGGQVIRRRLKEGGRDLPDRHVDFADPTATELFVRALRDKADLSVGAVATFDVLLRCMDAIRAIDGE